MFMSKSTVKGFFLVRFPNQPCRAAVHRASIMPTWFSEQQLEKIPAFSGDSYKYWKNRLEDGGG
jgi:hypothetical protein